MLDRLIDLLLSALDLFKFWQIVDEFERAVVLRFGKFHRVLEPGIHWLIPFNVERAILDNVVTRTWYTRGMTLALRDNTSAYVSLLVRYNIRDIKKAVLEVEEIDDVVRDSVFGNVSDMVRGADWPTLHSETFADDMAKRCRKQGWRYGVEIESVVFTDLCKAKPLSLLSGPT